MAEATSKFETIFQGSIKSVKELKAKLDELRGSLINLNTTSEDYEKTAEAVEVAQAKLTEVTSVGKKENIAATDSIVGMEREYKNLYTTYKTMSEEMRKSDFGKQTAESLKTLSEKLNETKMEVGNFKDNIGHYSEGVIDAFSKMGLSLGSFQKPFETLIAIVGSGKDSMTSSFAAVNTGLEKISKTLAESGGPMATFKNGLKGISAGFKALMANPVGATLIAIVAAFKALSAIVGKVKEAINSNEESQMRLKEAMSAFKPVIDAVNNAFDVLGQVVVKVIGFFADAFRKLREIGAAFTDFLGITKGANQRIKEQNKLYKDLAKSQNDIIKNKREVQKLNAKDSAEVERLREEASEATTLAEKKKLLTEAKEKQAEIDQRNIAVAKEELRVLQEQAKLTANDAAMNDKLAAAMAKVSEAEAQAAANMRQFNRQLNGGGGAIGNLRNYREEAKKLYEELIEGNKTEIQLLTEKYEKEKKLLEKYHYDTTLLTRKYNQDLIEARKKETEKLYAELEARQKWMMKAYRVSQLARGENEGEISKQFLDQDLSFFDALQESIENAMDDGKATFEEKLKVLQDAVANANANGIELEFPPENLPLKTEQDLQRVVDYVKAFGITLKKTVEEQKAQIEDSLINDRLTKSAQENLRSILEMELEAMSNGISGPELSEMIAKNTRKQLEEQKKALEEELANFKGTQEYKLELMQQYYDTVSELREKDLALINLSNDRMIESYTNVVNSMTQLGSAFGSIIGSQKTIIEQEVKDGKISEQEAEKKKKNLENLAKIQRDVAVIGIAADSAGAIMGIWRAYAAEKVVNAETAAGAGIGAAGVLAGLNTASLISAIAQTVGIGANAMAQIQAARAGYISTVNNLREAGSAAASVSSVSAVETQPFTYTRTVQTQDEEDLLNRPIYVTVTDIEEGLNKAKVTENESKF